MNNSFKFVYLLGSDNLEIKKNDEFIVYQGSHGDNSAEIADIILPSAAYTEQDGLYSNLEGRIQECRKASYPPGEAMEDWKIFNLISNNMNKINLFANFASLRKEVLAYQKNFVGVELLPKKTIDIKSKKNSQFIDEKIKINKIDYYFTNAISRASKTMAECTRVNKTKQ